MSDLTTIRCLRCGRWVVKVRWIDGRPVPVHWRRRRSTVRLRHDGVVTMVAPRHGRGWVEGDEEVDTGEDMPPYRRTVIEVQCGCACWTAVTTTE